MKLWQLLLGAGVLYFWAQSQQPKLTATVLGPTLGPDYNPNELGCDCYTPNGLPEPCPPGIPCGSKVTFDPSTGQVAVAGFRRFRGFRFR